MWRHLDASVRLTACCEQRFWGRIKDMSESSVSSVCALHRLSQVTGSPCAAAQYTLALVAVLGAGAALPAAAQEPLSIGQLLVKPSRWQLLNALDYGRHLPVPGVEMRGTQLTTGLRYGLGEGLEVNARWRVSDLTQTQLKEVRRRRESAASVGVNWLIKPETELPALLLESRVDVYLNSGGEYRAWPSGQLLLTAYQSLDPVVLSLSARVELSRSYESDGLTIDPGIAWSLAPQLNFAVNHRITLIGGLSFTRRAPDQIAGETYRSARERVGLSAGLGFALLPRQTLFLNGETGSDSGDASLSLQWFYEF